MNCGWRKAPFDFASNSGCLTDSQVDLFRAECVSDVIGWKSLAYPGASRRHRLKLRNLYVRHRRPRKIFVLDWERTRLFGYWQGSTGEPKRPPKYLLYSKKDPFSLCLLNPNFCAIVRSDAILTLPIKNFSFSLLGQSRSKLRIRSQCWAPSNAELISAHLFMCEVAPKRKTNTHHSQSRSLFKQGLFCDDCWILLCVGAGRRVRPTGYIHAHVGSKLPADL